MVYLSTVKKQNKSCNNIDKVNRCNYHFDNFSIRKMQIKLVSTYKCKFDD